MSSPKRGTGIGRTVTYFVVFVCPRGANCPARKTFKKATCTCHGSKKETGDKTRGKAHKEIVSAHNQKFQLQKYSKQKEYADDFRLNYARLGMLTLSIYTKEFYIVHIVK